MKKVLHSVLFMFCTAFSILNADAQLSAKSLLINHGSSGCGNQTPEQQFFSGSLTANPVLSYAGSLGVPYGGVFTAYNPADQKMYYADINGNTTKIYVANYNFGGVLSTPSFVTPTYTYSYVINQLCFDNLGNNYCFKSYNANNGKAKLEKIDITDGSTINGTTKDLQFPAGYVPNTVGSGDMVVLPNGRMFATFGDAPSMLYEFTQKPDGNYIVNYLTTLPRTCFSIAYVDGNLAISGSDGAGCYYYTWDINSSALSAASTFPGGKSSADMSNLTAGVGVTNLLTGVRSINTNTAQVYYQIVIKNKGNIYLNNVQVTEDLNQVFGAGNVSNVQISFLTNPGGLQLNPLYNGTTITGILLPGQSFDNNPKGTDSAVINVIATATNLVANKVYYNSALGTGSLGMGTTYLAVSDSSNNGSSSRMDLDNNGVSDDAGENVPTPFVFTPSLLSVQALTLQGQKQDETVKLTWQNVAADAYSSYEIESSVDGIGFQKLAVQSADNKSTETYAAHMTSSVGGMFYHIKGVKADNTIAFSNTVYIKNNSSVTLSAYPNPFHTAVSLQLQAEAKGTATLIIRDVAGRTIASKTASVEKGGNYITIAELQNAQPGSYFIEAQCSSEKTFIKLMKQ